MSSEPNTPPTNGKKRPIAHDRFRYGVFSRSLLLQEENPKAFKKLYTALYNEFQPKTAHEIIQVEKMIAAIWRTQRYWVIERVNTDLEAKKQDPAATPAIRATIGLRDQSDQSRFQDAIHRAETRYERIYHRAYNLLLKSRQSRNENSPFEPSPKNEHSAKKSKELRDSCSEPSSIP